MRAEHNFHFAIPLEVMKNSFGPKLKDLIGLTGENANEHEWFTGPVYTQPYLGGPEGTTSGNGVHMKRRDKEGEVPASLFTATPSSKQLAVAG